MEFMDYYVIAFIASFWFVGEIERRKQEQSCHQSLILTMTIAASARSILAAVIGWFDCLRVSLKAGSGRC
jgi:hypothetical protein